MLETILGILAGLFGGLNVLQFIFFRSTKKEYQARAEQAAIEAKDARFESLQKQINDMEALYKSQGDELKAVRQELLDVTKQKMQSDMRVTKLEAENEALKQKVEWLENEYRTINEK